MRLARPARGGGLIRLGRRIPLTRRLEPGGGFEEALGRRLLRDLRRTQYRHREAAAAVPAAGEALPAHREALVRPRAQERHVVHDVVADEDGVMPDGKLLDAEVP